MVAYQAFADLCRSSDSDERGHAAHLAALAYLDHDGPADEHAALYAALISFLDDPSVKVRAALAYGLLHSSAAPRPIVLALLRDSPIIARAVLQYSPILADVDLMPFVRSGDLASLMAIALRPKISRRIGGALLERQDDDLSIRLLRRQDVLFDPQALDTLSERRHSDPAMRGALLARRDLPAGSRLLLVRSAAESLRQCRMVKGALTEDRLERLFRDGTDTAVTTIGETVGAEPGFVRQLMGGDQINTRVLLHALVTGRIFFFSACIEALADVPRDKVFALLDRGSRPSLLALLARCGFSDAVARILVRIVMHARTADFADDLSARHYVLTVLTEELLAEYDGEIPPELEETFCYLSEQNIALARKAARGVMAAFAQLRTGSLSLPSAEAEPALALPAA